MDQDATWYEGRRLVTSLTLFPSQITGRHETPEFGEVDASANCQQIFRKKYRLEFSKARQFT